MSALSSVLERSAEYGSAWRNEPVGPVAPPPAVQNFPQTMPSAETAGQVPDRPIGSVLGPDGRPGLPALALYGADKEKETTLFKPGDLGREQIAEAAKEAGNLGNEPYCRTCSERKYVDVSGDSGVSFQSPTKLSPGQASAAVASHEQEHVRRNAAKADREDKQVIHSSVTLQMDNCPECGRSYVAGGTTRTTTAKVEKPNLAEELRGNLLNIAG